MLNVADLRVELNKKHIGYECLRSRKYQTRIAVRVRKNGPKTGSMEETKRSNQKGGEWNGKKGGSGPADKTPPCD